MKEDTLSYIRDNKEITFEQKIRLVLMRLWSEDWGQAVRLQ